MKDIIQLDKNNRCVSANCIYKDDDKTIEYEFDNEDERMNFFNNIENYEYNEESKMIDKIVFEVWAKLDSNNLIERIESTAFYSKEQLEEIGMIKIDEGTDGKIYGHAQPNYLREKYGKPMYDEQMRCNFKLVDGEVKKLTEEDIYNFYTKPQEIATAKSNQQVMLNNMMIKTQQVAFLIDLPDEQAATIPYCFEAWQVDVDYKIGDRVEVDGKLWKCKQAHKSQENWKPSIDTASLWEVIDVQHDGTEEDPIPYDITMTVYKDKYYIENGIIYKCIRDSGQPLYASCSSLVGNYFEVV